MPTDAAPPEIGGNDNPKRRVAHAKLFQPAMSLGTHWRSCFRLSRAETAGEKKRLRKIFCRPKTDKKISQKSRNVFGVRATRASDCDKCDSAYANVKYIIKHSSAMVSTMDGPP